MSDAFETQVMIGAEVRCTDGPCGRVRRLIVDSADAGILTHLSVKPDEFQTGRLVPADRIASADPELVLDFPVADFEGFESAEEMLLPPDGSDLESWPFAAHNVGGRVPVGFESFERDSAWANLTPTLDRIPAGGAEIRHGEPVYASDGEVGRTRGLVVDLRDRRVTHLLLDKGRLWARTRIAVPFAAVSNLADGVRLEMTKEQVDALPQTPSDEDG